MTVAQPKPEAKKAPGPDEMLISMGPHHPSTHGVLRLEMVLDGEVVVSCKPDIGYLHRGIEKIAENLTYAQFMPYTDRVDYVCAMNSNHREGPSSFGRAYSYFWCRFVRADSAKTSCANGRVFCKRAHIGARYFRPHRRRVLRDRK